MKAIHSSETNAIQMKDGGEFQWHFIEQREELTVRQGSKSEGRHHTAADSCCQDREDAEINQDAAQEQAFCCHHISKYTVEAASRHQKSRVPSHIEHNCLVSSAYGYGDKHFSGGVGGIAQKIACEQVCLPPADADRFLRLEQDRLETVGKTLQEATTAAMLFDKALAEKQAVKSKCGGCPTDPPEEEAPSRKRRRFQRRNSVVILPKHMQVPQSEGFLMLPSAQIGIIRSDKKLQACHSGDSNSTKVARAG